MIVGIGTDIVDISRVLHLVEKGDAFAQRVLTESEFDVYATKTQKHTYLAKRWSAKEAVSKALGTGIAQGITFKDIEVLNDDYGKPRVHLSGRALEVAFCLQIKHWHISISDEKHYAVSFVVAETA